jgi:hypothetical protein
MADEDESTAAKAGIYVLPHYLRFARTLALVSGATMGIAAGISVVTSSGCSSCDGICGEVMGVRPYGTGGGGGSMGVRPPDMDASGVERDAGAAGDTGTADATIDGGSADAGDEGGGPRPAPLLPRTWIG